MNYWIFVVTNQITKKGLMFGSEVYEVRMDQQFWGVGKNTHNRNKLEVGDKVVFYIGSPDMVFGGTAVIKAPCKKLSKEEKQKYWYEGVSDPEYGLVLSEIQKWENKKPMKEVLHKLSFIENKAYWWTYLQGGIRKLTETDYQIIVSDVSSMETISVESKESNIEFALEQHLEEFIFKNWDNINWPIPLSLYKTEDQNGRQFPADTWSIDFLALDVENNFVVIELKRGRSSDSVVGQILRYIAWVKDNLEGGKKVSGIIVANQIDESLKYAVKYLPDITVMLYQVDFQLNLIT